MAEALALRHVSAGYGDTVVLEDVSLALEGGETTAITRMSGGTQFGLEYPKNSGIHLPSGDNVPGMQSKLGKLGELGGSGTTRGGRDRGAGPVRAPAGS